MSTIKVTNLKHESSSSNNIVLDSSGRVGIGTSSPGRNFQVADSSNAFLSAKCGSVEGFINVTSSAVNLESSSGIPVTFSPGGTLRGQFDTSGNLKFNSGYGSVATAYGVRAWVNFNGTSTVAIRASGNVSSITDNGTGDYTVNFTTAMPDVNYSTTASVSNAPGTQNLVSVIYTDNTNTPAAPTTSAFRMQVTANSGEAKTDATYVCCSIFR